MPPRPVDQSGGSRVAAYPDLVQGVDVVRVAANLELARVFVDGELGDGVVVMANDGNALGSGGASAARVPLAVGRAEQGGARGATLGLGTRAEQNSNHDDCAAADHTGGMPRRRPRRASPRASCCHLPTKVGDLFLPFDGSYLDRIFRNLWPINRETKKTTAGRALEAPEGRRGA